MPHLADALLASLAFVVGMGVHEDVSNVIAPGVDSSAAAQPLIQLQTQDNGATRDPSGGVQSHRLHILLVVLAVAAFGAASVYHLVRSSRARRRVARTALVAESASLHELPELVTLHDASGNIRYASRPLRRLTGYTSAQLVGRRGRDFVHEDDVPALLEAVRGFSGRAPTRLRMRTRGGDYILLEARFENIVSPEGEPQLVCRSRCIATSSAGALELLQRELMSDRDVARPAEHSSTTPLGSALLESLARREFDLRYQPKVALVNWQVTGVEALLRWSAQAGHESIEDVIKEAERGGLIVPLGNWVVRTAVHQSWRWRRGGVNYPVAVNISHVQLRDPSFIALMRELLAQDRELKQYLHLEITGLALNSNDDASVRSLAQLASLGFSLHVDDFRTNLSSLSQLSRLPVAALKINRHVVQGMSRQGSDSDVDIAAVAAISRSLNIKVIGEGGETTAELDALRAYGFDEVQGFLLARPMTADSIEQLSGFNCGGL